MNRIVEHLYICDIDDYNFIGAAKLRYSILGACKDPLHRKYARVKGVDYDGYVTRSIGKDEPEYLYAERDHALYLNLVDARSAEYIPKQCIDKAIEFIKNEIADGRDVLIVCNKAYSRSPAIAMMYLIDAGYFDDCACFYSVECNFKDSYYPNYLPSAGIKEFTERYWEEKHGIQK